MYPLLALERSQPLMVYDCPAVTGTYCRLDSQPRVAASFKELFPEWALAGLVSMLACRCRSQLALPLSNPGLTIRLAGGGAVVVKVVSALFAVCPYPSTLVTWK